MQGEWSTYLTHDFLSDFRSSVSYGHNQSDPNLRAPDGTVLVLSNFPDADGGACNVSFGGNSARDGRSRTFTWENIADIQLYPPLSATHKALNFANPLAGIAQLRPGSDRLHGWERSRGPMRCCMTCVRSTRR